jgi:hypothetical protein
VDLTANTLQVPAGLIAQTAPITVPVTSTNVIASISATGVRNQAGTFALGGATTQVAGELCPGGGPAKGSACVAGGGVGGTMGLSGVLGFAVVPNVAVYPMTLSVIQLGLGGSASPVIGPADGAPWTLGVGQVAYTSNFTATNNTGTSVAFTTGSGSVAAGYVSLVTPSYVNLVGRAVPVLTRLELTFSVPEPGTVALWATGLSGLTALSRVRRRATSNRVQ